MQCNSPKFLSATHRLQSSLGNLSLYTIDTSYKVIKRQVLEPGQNSERYNAGGGYSDYRSQDITPLDSEQHQQLQHANGLPYYMYLCPFRPASSKRRIRIGRFLRKDNNVKALFLDPNLCARHLSPHGGFSQSSVLFYCVSKCHYENKRREIQAEDQGFVRYLL